MQNFSVFCSVLLKIKVNFCKDTSYTVCLFFYIWYTITIKRKQNKMNYISYKKNELKRIKINDLKVSIPDLRNTNKTLTIADWLILRIEEGLKNSSIKIGDLLPTKAEFAYALGVSLGTIQNVLKILEDKNYLYTKQCIGSIVKDRNEHEMKIRKRTSKKDIAEEKIKSYIKENNLGEGNLLPSSRNLARELNMALNTVRNAILKLTSEGILEYNKNKSLVIKNLDYSIDKDMDEETLVNKVKDDLKKYICENFKTGDKLPTHNVLVKKFNVSKKTIHSALQILVREKMLLPRRGSYGTVVINTSKNTSFEPRREMSIFAPAQDTAFYHYQKIQNKIKSLITNNYDIGQKLPSIIELSNMFDVNTNTIRRALKNLAGEGYLQFARGRQGGTFIIDIPEETEQTFRWLAVNPQYTKTKV